MKKRRAARKDDFSLFFNLELMGFPAASADSVVSVYPILSARPHLLYLRRFPPSEPNRLVCVNSLLLQKREDILVCTRLQMLGTRVTCTPGRLGCLFCISG